MSACTHTHTMHACIHDFTTQVLVYVHGNVAYIIACVYVRYLLHYITIAIGIDAWRRVYVHTSCQTVVGIIIAFDAFPSYLLPQGI
jgi:type IV secretory pathway VirB2 component (pilin)